MWATDATQIATVQDGKVWLFGVAEHWNAELIGWHVAKRGTRFEALQAVGMAVRSQFGRVDAGAARGLALRHDHGSNLRYDLVGVVDALAALKALGIGDIAQSAAQWDHVSFVEERSHPFLSDGPLEFGEGFVVARKQVVPDNGRAGGIDHLERPLGFVLKPNDRDLYSDAVLLHDP
jgi:hypothetical protein